MVIIGQNKRTLKKCPDPSVGGRRKKEVAKMESAVLDLINLYLSKKRSISAISEKLGNMLQVSPQNAFVYIRILKDFGLISFARKSDCRLKDSFTLIKELAEEGRSQYFVTRLISEKYRYEYKSIATKIGALCFLELVEFKSKRYGTDEEDLARCLENYNANFFRDIRIANVVGYTVMQKQKAREQQTELESRNDSSAAEQRFKYGIAIESTPLRVFVDGKEQNLKSKKATKK
jgi:hypothetical protein